MFLYMLVYVIQMRIYTRMYFHLSLPSSLHTHVHTHAPCLTYGKLLSGEKKEDYGNKSLNTKAEKK